MFVPPEIFWSILDIAGTTIAATSVLFVQPLKARWVEASTPLVQRGKTFALPLLERALEFAPADFFTWRRTKQAQAQLAVVHEQGAGTGFGTGGIGIGTGFGIDVVERLGHYAAAFPFALLSRARAKIVLMAPCREPK